MGRKPQSRASASRDGGLSPVEAVLAERFRGAPVDLDVAIAVATESGETLAAFAIEAGQLRFAPRPSPDMTLIFASADAALGVLGGGADPMAAFMAGDFRADSHLPLAFVALGLFRASAPRRRRSLGR